MLLLVAHRTSTAMDSKVSFHHGEHNNISKCITVF